GAVTLVPAAVRRGLRRWGWLLRVRLGGGDRGALRRLDALRCLLGGSVSRLDPPGGGGRRRGRRLGGEHRGGEQADGQQGRGDSLHRQGSSLGAVYTAVGRRVTTAGSRGP